VLAQRLVRSICESCREPVEVDPSEIPPGCDIEPGALLYKGAGCRDCRNTGFKGRVGVFELLSMTEELRDMVMQRTNARRIAQAAVESGQMKLLQSAGYDKVRAGATTFAEVLRATKE
jgi:type II secretory ATPase GspE/PulE/Tfp pilus assembly ATPase PilB-like protein